MSKVFKRRYVKTNINNRTKKIIIACFLVLAVFTTLGYSLYREQIANALSLSINRPTFTVTLNNQSADSGHEGTGSIYVKYLTGYYLDSGLSNLMTTSDNSITVPDKTDYAFDGYYTETNGGGTQYIDENGLITSSASTIHFTDNSGVLYANWIPDSYTVTVNAVHGTPATQDQTVNQNASASITVNPSSTYSTDSPQISCTNGQTATYADSTLTINSVTDNTVCTITFGRYELQNDTPTGNDSRHFLQIGYGNNTSECNTSTINRNYASCCGTNVELVSSSSSDLRITDGVYYYNNEISGPSKCIISIGLMDDRNQVAGASCSTLTKDAAYTLHNADPPYNSCTSWGSSGRSWMTYYDASEYYHAVLNYS